MTMRESDTHRYVPRYHQATLVMPWGLTNTLVTLQHGRQLPRHLLWFDALNRTWEEPLSHLSGTYILVPTTDTIHWDLVISVQGAQWEFQTLLEQCPDFSTPNIWSGRLPIWWWDPGIHQSDGLLRMRLTIDEAEVAIRLHHDGDVVRGVVEFFFSLIMPRIEDSCGLTGVDFTEISWQSMIHDREFQEKNI
jgi:hypothetical protein